MPYRPPLANHPRAAIVVSLLLPLALFGWVVPRITGEPRRWPLVILLSFTVAVVTYLARTRSRRFVSYLTIGVSVAALVVYGAALVTQGFPQTSSERVSLALVVALPLVGVAIGAWMLQHAPRRSPQL